MGSFDVDLSGLLETASSIFNAIAPIMLAVAGISVGLGLLMTIVMEIRKAF